MLYNGSSLERTVQDMFMAAVVVAGCWALARWMWRYILRVWNAKKVASQEPEVVKVQPKRRKGGTHKQASPMSYKQAPQKAVAKARPHSAAGVKQTTPLQTVQEVDVTQGSNEVETPLTDQITQLLAEHLKVEDACDASSVNDVTTPSEVMESESAAEDEIYDEMDESREPPYFFVHGPQMSFSQGEQVFEPLEQRDGLQLYTDGKQVFVMAHVKSEFFEKGSSLPAELEGTVALSPACGAMSEHSTAPSTANSCCEGEEMLRTTSLLTTTTCEPEDMPRSLSTFSDEVDFGKILQKAPPCSEQFAAMTAENLKDHKHFPTLLVGKA
eukprot:TRINITY_DN13684_c0_g1_i1.p1 TRINITY_DN13684_c0_g1~~TRINITY_DN13684_c0_g1_i1.p1  ORF type:complete len:327 (-),score=73.54 TRINITY_DN13684_c0_g1_i1:210-1190(-)